MSNFWAQRRCVGMKENKDWFFADWVRHAPVNSLDRFAGPSLAACAQVKSQKISKRNVDVWGWSGESLSGPGTAQRLVLQRNRDCVPEIGKVVAIAN